jgi:hypothetical protein
LDRFTQPGKRRGPEADRVGTSRFSGERDTVSTAALDAEEQFAQKFPAI